VLLIDGEPDGGVSALDRGLHYGDGLFETLAVRDRRPLLLDRHLSRLQAGCARLGIEAPATAVLRREIEVVAATRELGVVKILFTRGRGGRGYAPPEGGRPTRIVLDYPWPDYPRDRTDRGVRVRMCATRLACNPRLAGLKHLNRLEQVLARSEWTDPEVAEGLMLDLEGAVVEGTMSNLFVVGGGRLLTPDLSRCGVAGVMRGLVLDLAHELGLPAAQTRVEAQDLDRASELFLSNSLIGLWPVRRLEERALEPGPVCRRLQAELRARGVLAVP
jgi:4-amino-4-deoxychorismate lyase